LPHLAQIARIRQLSEALSGLGRTVTRYTRKIGCAIVFRKQRQSSPDVVAFSTWKSAVHTCRAAVRCRSRQGYDDFRASGHTAYSVHYEDHEAIHLTAGDAGAYFQITNLAFTWYDGERQLPADFAQLRERSFPNKLYEAVNSSTIGETHISCGGVAIARTGPIMVTDLRH